MDIKDKQEGIKGFSIDKSSLEQLIHGSTLTLFIVRNNWAYPPSASGSCRRLGRRQANEIWVDFKTFKIL